MDNNLTTFFTSNLNMKELETHLSNSKSGVDEVKAKRIISRIEQLTNDIEMISKLAEVFNVSIEELIYGEKRKLDFGNIKDCKLWRETGCNIHPKTVEKAKQEFLKSLDKVVLEGEVTE